jgi:adenosylcobinamide-GDP ribazoletransferase
MDDRPQALRDGPQRLLQAFLNALGFLTRLPLPKFQQLSLAEASVAFPLAGLLIGGVSGAALAFFSGMAMTPLIAAGLALAVTALLTGALHEDGLADVADGFGGGSTRERKLEIMRDSRTGTYGVVALVLVLLIKASALASLAALPAWQAMAVLAGTGAASRGAMVWLLHAMPPARSDGLGASAARPVQKDMLIAVALGSVFGLAGLWLGVGLVPALTSMVIAAIAAAVMRYIAMRQIGGQTGDVCGALQVVSEVLMLSVAVATLS